MPTAEPAEAIVVEVKTEDEHMEDVEEARQGTLSNLFFQDYETLISKKRLFKKGAFGQRAFRKNVFGHKQFIKCLFC